MFSQSILRIFKMVLGSLNTSKLGTQKIACWFGVVFCVVGLCLPAFFGGYISGSIYNSQNEIEKSDYRFFWSNGKGEYTYILDVPIHITTNRVLHVFPNDCIKQVFINHKEYLGLSGDLCNYRDGVALDGKDYLQLGNNVIQIKVTESSGSRAFVLKPSYKDPIRIINFVILGLGLLLLLYFYFAQGFQFQHRVYSFWFQSLFLAMFILGMLFFLRSDYFQWSFDQTGHLDYLKLLLRGEWLPMSDACWQCYHPNTYYWFGEAVYRFGQYTGWADPFELLRWISYCIWWVGIVFAFKTLYLLFIQKKSSYIGFMIASCIFGFWPLNFYFGARISNEVVQHSLSYLSIYYSLLAWYSYQDGNDNKLKTYSLVAIISCIFGLYIKSNSIIWLPLAGLGLICRYIENGRKEFWRLFFDRKLYLIKIVCISLCCVIGIVVLSRAKGVHGIVDNLDRINAGNSVSYVSAYEALTTFHVQPFVMTSDMRKAPDDRERRSFRNFMAKTSLLGEFGITKKKNLFFLPFYLATALFFFVLTLYRFFTANLKKQIFPVLGFFVPILAMIINRIVNPYASAMHYRFILPQIVFISYFSIYWIVVRKQLSDYRVIDYVQLILIFCFVAGSIAFSLPPYF